MYLKIYILDGYQTIYFVVILNNSVILDLQTRQNVSKFNNFSGWAQYKNVGCYSVYQKIKKLFEFFW